MRTVPEKIYRSLPRGEFTILEAYLGALRGAQHLIYLENQFLWSSEVVGVLRDKLLHPPNDSFRLVLVLPVRPNNGADDTRGQLGVLAEADGGAGRFLACTLYTPGGPQAQKVYVHAKVGIVDDRWLTLGSANLNEHSLFNDTEVNVVINDEAARDVHATAALRRAPRAAARAGRGRRADAHRRAVATHRAGAARTARGRRPSHAPARPAPARLTALEAAARSRAEPARRWLAPPTRGIYSPQGWDGRERGSRSFPWGARPVSCPSPRRLRHTDRVEWRTDIHEAEWIAPRLHPFLTDVGSVIPVGYEAYARIFHPVPLATGGFERWCRRRRAKRPYRPPRDAVPPHRHAARRATPDDDPWLWSAHAGGRKPSTRDPPRARRTPAGGRGRRLVLRLGRVRWPRRPGRRRACRAARPQLSPDRGPIATALESALDARDQSAELWWPRDRTWFVSTEIDYAWTYLGGPAQLIDDVLGEPRLEALAASVTDKPFYDGDLLNAARG